MEEIWVSLRETDLYEASSEGYIRNVRTGRILKNGVHTDGRVTVTLYIHGEACTRAVCRLVAEAFYGSECDGMEVYHYDGNKQNNHIENLRIGTHSDAMRNAYRTGRKQPNQMKRIRCIETGEEWDSIDAASLATGIHRVSVSKCASKATQKVKDGRHFEFLD